MKMVFECRKILLIVFVFFSLIFSVSAKELNLPSPNGYVLDQAHVLSPDTVTKINSVVYELDKKTTAQIAVVTLKSLEGKSVEDVSLDIGRKWGVGAKGKNNGMVILVVPSERKLRLEVGYGLEGMITDAHAGRIRDEYMKPYFRQGNYDKGVLMAVYASADDIAKGYGVKLTNSYSVKFNEPGYKLTEPVFVFLFTVGVFVLIIVMWIIASINQMFANVLAPFVGFLLCRAGSYQNKYNATSDYYSGFSGGSSSGTDFGGFGGGDFGGGGASGDW